MSELYLHAKAWRCVLVLTKRCSQVFGLGALVLVVSGCTKEKRAVKKAAVIPGDAELYKPIPGLASQRRPLHHPRRYLKRRRILVRDKRGRAVPLYRTIRIKGRVLRLRYNRRTGKYVFAKGSHRLAKANFYFAGFGSLLRPWELLQIANYKRRGCTIAPLSGQERAMAKKALLHAVKALRSFALLRMIRDRRFTYTSMPGREIIRRVKRIPVQLKVLGYKGRRFSCRVGRESYAFIVYSLIFLNRAHLQRKRGSRGWRGLAGTIAHEWMHALRFHHGGSGVNPGTYTEQNSVPHYIGCLVRHYPDLTRGKINCGRRI